MARSIFLLMLGLAELVITKHTHTKKITPSEDLESLSYGELAGNFTTSVCGTMQDNFVMLNEDSQPNGVKALRKSALYCRDTLDVFVFAYPEFVVVNERRNHGRNKEVDVWAEMRKDIDNMYEQLGHYQDLSAAKVNYTEAERLRLLQNAIDSRDSFLKKNETLNYFGFIAKPSHGKIHARKGAKLTRLFWGTEKKGKSGGKGAYEDVVRPSNELTGLQNVALLTRTIINRAKHFFFQKFIALEHVWVEENQEQFHNMRKLIRGVKTIQMYFPEMVPNYNLVHTSMESLDAFYDRIGTLNDVISKYFWYEKHGPKEMLKPTREEVDVAWKGLQTWAEETDIGTLLGWLRLHLYDQPLMRTLANNVNGIGQVPKGVIFSGPNTPVADTDSIAAAHAAAWLFDGIPASSGSLSPETLTAIAYVKASAPKSLSNIYAEGNKLGLVDYNQYDQASEQVLGHLDDVVAVIDHHAITPRPIAPSDPLFMDIRKMGACSSVVADIAVRYSTKKMPSDVAGMLLAGIVSDTLNFTSDTTTPQDYAALSNLLSISGISNFTDFSYQLMRARTDLSSKTSDEIVNSNFEAYSLQSGDTVGFSAVATVVPESVLGKITEISPAIERLRTQHGLKYAYFSVLDFLTKYAVIFCPGEEELRVARAAFPSAPFDETMHTVNVSSYISTHGDISSAITGVLSKGMGPILTIAPKHTPTPTPPSPTSTTTEKSVVTITVTHTSIIYATTSATIPTTTTVSSSTPVPAPDTTFVPTSEHTVEPTWRLRPTHEHGSVIKSAVRFLECLFVP